MKPPMNRLFLIALLLCLSAGANAQKVREEMLARPTMTGGNLCPYPGPQSRLTAPPKGKRPFYISHYGRHGSRYLLVACSAIIPKSSRALSR